MKTDLNISINAQCVHAETVSPCPIDNDSKSWTSDILNCRTTSPDNIMLHCTRKHNECEVSSDCIDLNLLTVIYVFTV